MNALYSSVAPGALVSPELSVAPGAPADGDRKTPPIECQTISVEDAGKVLGIARNTAYAAARAGQIPAVRIGRKIRVPKAALQRLLDGEVLPELGGRS